MNPMDEVAVASQLATLTTSLTNVERMLVEVRDTVVRQQAAQDTRIGAQEQAVQTLKLDFAQHCGQTQVDEVRRETQHFGQAQADQVRRETQAEKEKRVADELVAQATRLTSLEKLAPAIRVVIWIGGLLGASVVALIWALITGQAVLAFP